MKKIRPFFLIAALYLLPSLVGSCIKQEPIEPGSRAQCEPCAETIDCTDGLTCQGFFNKQGVYMRCAGSGTTQCSG